MKKIILLTFVFLAAQAKASEQKIAIDDVDFDSLVSAEELEQEMHEEEFFYALDGDEHLEENQMASFDRHPPRRRPPRYRPPHRRPPRYRPRPPRYPPPYYRSYICYARDGYNRLYHATHRHPRVAQDIAIDRCHRRARYCYADGCRRRR